MILAGFVYDVLFAGIPYQDPTPQMQADYDFHAKLASVARWVGGCGIGVGVAIAGYRGAFAR